MLALARLFFRAFSVRVTHTKASPWKRGKGQGHRISGSVSIGLAANAVRQQKGRPRPVAVESHPPWRGTRPTEREARSGQRVGWVEPGARAIAGALVSSMTTSITATLEEVRNSRLRLGLGSVGQGLAKSKKPSFNARFARQIKHRKRRGRKLAHLDDKAVLIHEK
jgi:hypothetical protein